VLRELLQSTQLPRVCGQLELLSPQQQDPPADGGKSSDNSGWVLVGSDVFLPDVVAFGRLYELVAQHLLAAKGSKVSGSGHPVATWIRGDQG
jgi:hypothetical protein